MPKGNRFVTHYRRGQEPVAWTLATSRGRWALWDDGSLWFEYDGVDLPVLPPASMRAASLKAWQTAINRFLRRYAAGEVRAPLQPTSTRRNVFK